MTTVLLLVVTTAALVPLTGCGDGRLGADLPEAEVVSQETTITGVFFATGRSIVEERRVVDASAVYVATMDEWLDATPELNTDVAVVQPEAEVISISLEDGLLTIDWSAEVLDFEGTEEEQLVALASILRMFGQFPEVEQVRFTVQGQEDGEIGGKDVTTFWGSVALVEQPWDVFRPQPRESEEATSSE